MDNTTVIIDTRHIDFHPDVPRLPTDALELFAYVATEMRNPADIPPLMVRFDEMIGKYVVVCNGPTYEREGILLEAARKLGLSTVPCRVVGDSSPPTGGGCPNPSPAPIMPAPELSPALLDANALSKASFNALFRDILQALAGMARTVRQTSSALRVGDDEDWLQVATIALWRELQERDVPRLRDADAVRRYVFAVLHKQAFRAKWVAARDYRRSQKATDFAKAAVEEAIAAEEEHRLDEEVEAVQVMIGRADQALGDALSRLPCRDATVIKAWLDGAGLIAAGSTAGMTLAQVRRRITQLKSGSHASHLGVARDALEKLYRLRPAAATRIRLGRLARLL